MWRHLGKASKIENISADVNNIINYIVRVNLRLIKVSYK